MAFKICLCFPTTNLYKGGFSLYTVPKTAYCNKLKKTSRKIQLSCVKSELREIFKKVKQSLFSFFWFILCYSGWHRFHKNVLSMLM